MKKIKFQIFHVDRPKVELTTLQQCLIQFTHITNNTTIFNSIHNPLYLKNQRLSFEIHMNKMRTLAILPTTELQAERKVQGEWQLPSKARPRRHPRVSVGQLRQLRVQ